MKKITKLQKENCFLRVRNLLADELIMNLKLQNIYGILFEGSELEREFIKLSFRYNNEKHLNKINVKRNDKES